MASDANSITNITSVILAITALAAVIISPLVSLWIAKRQNRIAEQQLNTQLEIAKSEIAASVLSRNRQAWINKLRNYIAEYATAIVMIITPGHKFEVNAARVEKIMLLLFKIQLMINPDEENHKKLVDLLQKGLQEVTKILHDTGMQNSEKGVRVRQITQEIVPLSQTILKDEWKRVKTLE